MFTHLQLIIFPSKQFFKNGPTPASFSFIFHLLKNTLQILQQIGM